MALTCRDVGPSAVKIYAHSIITTVLNAYKSFTEIRVSKVLNGIRFVTEVKTLSRGLKTWRVPSKRQTVRERGTGTFVIH
jgi:hypothetical protein